MLKLSCHTCPNFMEGLVKKQRTVLQVVQQEIKHGHFTAGPRKICSDTDRQKSHLLLSTNFCILFVLIYLVRFPTKSKRWDFCWPVPINNVSLIYKVGFLPAGAETRFHQPSCSYIVCLSLLSHGQAWYDSMIKFIWMATTNLMSFLKLYFRKCQVHF